MKLVYTVKGDVFSVNDLDFLAAGKVRMTGAVSYDLKNKSGKLDVVLKEMPISVWLPAELKTLTDAMIEGNVQWQGSVKEWQQSSASGQLDFGGASVENPVRSIASIFCSSDNSFFSSRRMLSAISSMCLSMREMRRSRRTRIRRL